jgi:hypothetical protein
LNIDEALKAVLAPRVDGLLINADAVDFRQTRANLDARNFPLDS